MATKPDQDIARLFKRAELNFSQVQESLEALRAGMGLERVGAGASALEAGNTACDSGCDSSCGGALMSAENVKAIGQARLTSVFDARRTAGLERIGQPGGGLEAGNDACDSGCDSGCAGRLSRAGAATQGA